MPGCFNEERQARVQLQRTKNQEADAGMEWGCCHAAVHHACCSLLHTSLRAWISAWISSVLMDWSRRM